MAVAALPLPTYKRFFFEGFFSTCLGLIQKSPVILGGTAVAAGAGYLVGAGIGAVSGFPRAGKIGTVALASIASFALSLLHGTTSGCCLECWAGRDIPGKKIMTYVVGALLPTLIAPLTIIGFGARAARA